MLEGLPGKRAVGLKDIPSEVLLGGQRRLPGSTTWREARSASTTVMPSRSK